MKTIRYFYMGKLTPTHISKPKNLTVWSSVKSSFNQASRLLAESNGSFSSKSKIFKAFEILSQIPPNKINGEFHGEQLDKLELLISKKINLGIKKGYYTHLKQRVVDMGKKHRKNDDFVQAFVTAILKGVELQSKGKGASHRNKVFSSLLSPIVKSILSGRNFSKTIKRSVQNQAKTIIHGPTKMTVPAPRNKTVTTLKQLRGDPRPRHTNKLLLPPISPRQKSITPAFPKLAKPLVKTKALPLRPAMSIKDPEVLLLEQLEKQFDNLFSKTSLDQLHDLHNVLYQLSTMPKGKEQLDKLSAQFLTTLKYHFVDAKSNKKQVFKRILQLFDVTHQFPSIIKTLNKEAEAGEKFFLYAYLKTIVNQETQDFLNPYETWESFQKATGSIMTLKTSLLQWGNRDLVSLIQGANQ
jgi:hypothetical protein